MNGSLEPVITGNGVVPQRLDKFESGACLDKRFGLDTEVAFGTLFGPGTQADVGM
jgi:hypothetical protein